MLTSGRGLSSILSLNSIKNSNCEEFNNGLGIRWSAISESGARWSRELLIISRKELILKDFFSNALLAQGCINFPPNIKIKSIDENQVFIIIGKSNLIINIAGASRIWLENAVFYPSYGEQKKSMKLCWKAKMKNNIGKTIISFINE